MAEYVVAVDVGGTFTDVFARDLDSSAVVVRKVPSNPAHPAKAIVDGVLATGIPPAEITLLTHGTTVGTNALVTRSFPRTALIMTAGFRDVLEIGKSTKPHLWDAYVDVSPPYIARRDRFGVTERQRFDGSELVPVAEDEVVEIARILRRREIGSVGVCLINSYADGAHEQQVRDILMRENPDLLVSLSSDVLPEIFEFERTSTTATNAVLGPVVDGYMRELVDDLRGIGYAGEVLVLHSGGGVMSADTVTSFAARIAASGPAGGAVAMSRIARDCGFDDAIGFDVGGTTSDVSVSQGGSLRITKEWGVEYGHPIAFPSIELVTIGAGGGSVAWLDQAGALRSGPQSAGAEPGPASYGAGGTVPTTTDANLVCGRLGTAVIGGRSILDPALARAAIREHVADPMGLSVEDAADAVLRVVTANMTEAIRLVSIERGLDPRDFALVAFGGGGPLHAADVAREASIPTVIVPPFPGVTSAVGCQMVDIAHDLGRTVVTPLTTEGVRDLETVFADLEREGRERLERESVRVDRVDVKRVVEMRYAGQWRTIGVTVADGVPDRDALVKAFHAEHEREYSYSDVESVVEVSGVRMTVVGVLPTVPDMVAEVPAAFSPEPVASRPVYDARTRAYVDVPVYHRAALTPGAAIRGPAIVEQSDTTAFVPDYATADADGRGNLLIRIGDIA